MKPGPKATHPKKDPIDYTRIENGWRAGILSPRQLAAQYTEETGQKVSHAAIIKHFVKEGVPRNLAAKIQAKADELVTRAAVTEEVTQGTRNRDKAIIDANANAVASVRLAHRRDIQRARSITVSLLEELEGQTGADAVALLSDLGDMMRNPDKHGQDKLNDLYHKIISLPGRAKTMKDLGESLRVLVGLERQAFGLDDKDNAPEDALTALLRGISQGNGNAFRPVQEDPEHASKAIGGAFAPVAETEED